MNECRELEPLLAPYADGEAAPVEATRVRAHVEACPCCRGRLERQQAAREAMCARRHEIRGCAPDGLKARCAAHARAAQPVAPRVSVFTPSRPTVPFYRRWVPLTAAATVLLAVIAVFGLGLTQKAHALAFQATVDHVKCARFHMGPTAADPVAAAQAWQQRFGWPIKVPASSRDNDLELRTVRRCAVTDGRVAHLIYMWNGEPLSLYVLPTDVVSETPEIVERFGHRSTIWSQNDRTYMLVSERHDAALERVVAYVRANAY